MTVPAASTNVRATTRDADAGRRNERADAAGFDAAMRKRKRGRDGRAAEDEPQPTADGTMPPAWAMLAARTAVLSTAGAATGASGGMAESAAAATPPASADFPAGTEVDMASHGRALRLRFTEGQWAGVEMQAALHAGQVVVTLKPLNRLQQRRLSEARASLCEQVAEETGHQVRLEIADAAR